MATKWTKYIEQPTESMNITANGTYDVTKKAQVVVNAQLPTETFDVTPTTDDQSVTPSTGHVFSGGTVRAMPTGSATTPATTKVQSTPTFSQSGNTVTASVAATSVDITPTVVPGYVSSGTAGTVTMSASSNTYTIPSGHVKIETITEDQPAPRIFLDSATGEISATVNGTSTIVNTSEITNGYITSSEVAGGWVQHEPNGSTYQLDTQSAKTVTPSTSSQTAVAAGKYTTGAVTVAAMPTGSIAVNTPTINTSTGVVTASTTLSTAGYIGSNPSSKTLSLSTQSAKTVYATTSSQTAVAANKYTTGAVTVGALSQTNLMAPCIRKNVTVTINNGNTNVWSVTGTSVTLIEISNEAEMPMLLTSENVGNLYKYTGPTGTYINGDIYLVESD